MRHTILLLVAAIAATVDSSAQSSVKLQGSIRSRVEAWDWFGDSPYAYSGNIARVAISQQRPGFDWTLELAAPLLLGLPDRPGALGLGANYYSANHNRQVTGFVFAKQAFVQFKPGGAESTRIRVGRFEFVDGTETTPTNATLAALKRDRIAHRLLGNFAWTHVGRSFDGLHLTTPIRSMNFTLVAAAPTRGVFQVDGWGPLRTGIAYAALSGKRPFSDWRAFALYYRDWRRVVKTDNRPLVARRDDFGSPEIWTYGGHWLQLVPTKSGPVDLLAWGSLQNGRWGRLDHRAGAVALEAGYQPKALLPKWKPWIRGGYFRGSGDSNPNDQNHGTFFEALPTPRVYARFPFFNLMNLDDRFGSFILRPSKQISIRSDLHVLQLANQKDLWYAGGGAFQPWTFGYQGRGPASAGGGLANLADASVDWSPSPRVSFTAYYGRAFGRAVTKQLFASGPSANFGYLEATYRF